MALTLDGNKAVFTTGEVAEICRISQQTVIRCFDSGRLGGFRVPGSKFRRIPRDELVRFMRENRIPFQEADHPKRRVLVVDDDEGIIEMLSEILTRDGRFEVRTACSGFEAGLLCDQFRPALMILDFKLPDINGNVVCGKLRSNPDFHHIKIILVSGVVDPDEVEHLLKAGADEFVKKPFDINAMISLMVRLLQL